jgi:hypothetical protein
MRFLDVDAVEVDLVPVLAVDLVQAPGLSSEGRSGVGTEDQGYGAPTVSREML